MVTSIAQNYISDLYPVQQKRLQVEKEIEQLLSENPQIENLSVATDAAREYCNQYFWGDSLPNNQPRWAQVNNWTSTDEDGRVYIQVTYGQYGIGIIGGERFYCEPDEPIVSIQNRTTNLKITSQKQSGSTYTSIADKSCLLSAKCEGNQGMMHFRLTDRFYDQIGTYLAQQ